jgi:hypothetical protein
VSPPQEPGITADPALLDVMSITPERVLLLDAYFYVVVFHGATVAQVRAAPETRFLLALPLNRLPPHSLC